MGISRKKVLKPMPGAPVMPRGLSGAAADCWHELMGEVSIVGTLTRGDSAALEVLASALAQYRKACAAVEVEGEVLTLPNGILSANPWIRIRKNSGDFLQRMLGEFALTPASRAKVKMPEKPLPEDDPLAEFLQSPGA